MRAGTIAALGALLTLVVVSASAAIRLGGDELGQTVALVRGVHRAAASLAALFVLALFFIALRSRESRAACTVALVLMVALSAVGWATGTQPPRAAALFNQLGGAALAAMLAWIAGRCGREARGTQAQCALAQAAVVIASAQIAFGAALTALAVTVTPAVTIAHAVLGVASALLAAAVGAQRLVHSRSGLALIACAMLAPIAGTAAVASGAGFALAVAHATSAALLLAALAQAHGSLTRSA